MKKNSWERVSALTVFAIGFMVAMVGVSGSNHLDAAEKTVKESIAFGTHRTPIDVYVFTDWACPACRKLEPSLEKMAPAIMKQAQLVFVDFAIHPETLNFSPYNVSFMVNNKPKYLILRHILSKLSAKTGTPTDRQIETIAQKVNVKFTPLNHLDANSAANYFKRLGKQFKITSTPTVVVVNRDTRKGKKLIGTSEITQNNVLKVIAALES